jgi:outer membrane lipoprotein-sorting protein
MSVFTDEQMSEGKFYFRDENMIRWEYFSPFKYLIVINNEKLTIQDEGKTNTYDLSTGNIFSAIGDNLGSILQGKFSAGNDFKVKYFQNAMSYKAELIPADETMKGFFNRIIIFYDKRQFGVSGVILNEPDGDFTRIVFKNSKPNAVVDPDLFIIK